MTSRLLTDPKPTTPETAKPTGDASPCTGAAPAGERFLRCHRLTRPTEFRDVFARPRVSQDSYFRVLHRDNAGSASRLGLAVSTKVCKHAVGRNRLKRLVRESFRHHQAVLSAHGGQDIVVLPSRQAATICNSELTASLQAHWRRVGGGETRPQRPRQHAARRDTRTGNKNDG